MVAGGSSILSFDPNDPIVKHLQKIKEENARAEKSDYSHAFRPKSRLDIIRLSCIVVGIELAYSAETAFVSPILLQIGIEHKHMTMVWALSPLLGFFVAPILGSVSDRCRLRLGRRRPILILLSLGVFLGLLLVPYGRDIGMLLGDVGESMGNQFNYTDSGVVSASLVQPGEGEFALYYKFAAVFTILGTMLLDFSADTCQTPARTYLLDVCIPGDHSKAMSTFTIMAGLGGCLGYALGAINWEETKIGDLFGGNIKAVFGIVTIAFIICFLITITSFREIPLKLLERDEMLRPITAAAIRKEMAKNNNDVYTIKEHPKMIELNVSNMSISRERTVDKPIVHSRTIITNGAGMSAPNKDMGTFTEMIESSECDEKITLGQYLKSIIFMPKSMRILSLTNLLCWMSFVCYCLYFTDFVGEAVFEGDPSAAKNSEKFNLYQEGVRFGCWGLSVFSLSCSVYSCIVEKLIRRLSTKVVYIGGILVYGIGMLILGLWPTKPGVLIFSTTAGIIYATLFTMPFVLVAQYHSQGCFRKKSGENVPLKENRGLGTDVAIISSMVFIAQLIVSLSIGSLIAALNTTSAVLYAASALSLCAAISATAVLYLD